MSSEDVNNEEERVNNLEEQKNEGDLKDIIWAIVGNQYPTLDISEMTKLANEFVPTTKIKSKNQCLEKYEITKEPESEWRAYYVAKKDGIEYFIKRRSMEFVDKERLKKLITEVELIKIASDKNIGPKLHELFLCKNDTSELHLYMVFNKLEGKSLDKWKEENVIGDKEKKEIKELINKYIENGIIPSWISTSNIFVLDNGEFRLTSLNDADKVDDLLETKKNDLIDSLEWLTSNKIRYKNLIVRKMIREKKITYCI